MQIIKGKQARPQRLVVYGPEGIGKSTLAANCPNPLFMDLENGTSTMDVARLPKPHSWSMMSATLKELKDSPPAEYSTLVIDTADWAERLCLRHVCDEGGKTSIEDFGYGKGFVKAEETWGRFLDFLTDFSEVTGWNVVLLAHAHLKKFERPDESGAYDRYELKLSKKLSPLTKEWADAVLFVNYKILVVEDESTHSKKAQGGKRVIYTTHHVCWDAKNRNGLPGEIDFLQDNPWAPFGDFFPSASPVSAPAPVLAPEPAPKPEPQKEEAPPPETRVAKEDPSAFPYQLFELMDRDHVTDEEIRKAVSQKGYYPFETPIGNYEDQFVQGVLVAAWPQVLNMINEIRKAA